jgi:hypothetical protein
MNEDIARMAREAGLLPEKSNIVYQHSMYELFIERFAALVAAHTLSKIDPRSFMSWQEGYEAGKLAEREACAEVCEQSDRHRGPYFASLIRERGRK